MSTSHFVFHNGQLIESKKIVGLVLEKKDDQTIISIANDVEINTPLHFTFLSDRLFICLIFLFCCNCYRFFHYCWSF